MYCFHIGYRRHAFDIPFLMTNYVQSVVVQRKLYVGGGVAGIGSSNNYIVMEYDISSRKWHPLSSYRAQYFAITAINNQLVLVGGAEYSSGASKVLGVWDTNHRTWTHPYPDMLERRSGCSAIVYNKWLVVAGGWANRCPLSSVEVMNTDSKQQYFAPETPIPWYCMKTAVVGDIGYFMGGTDRTGSSYTTNVYQVCIKTLISHATSIPSSRTEKPMWNVIHGLQLSGTSPLSMNGSLLLVGGLDEDCKPVTDILLYQSETGKLVNVGLLPSPRYNCTCAMITDSDLLVILGEDNPFKQLPSMELAQIKY